LDRLVLLGEQHLRRALAEYVEHYHRERNHQGLGNELIDGVPGRQARGTIRHRERVGGLLNYYFRAA
jgi:transposase InsO family protein